MAPKSNKQNVAPAAVETQPEEDGRTKYSKAEKIELIANFQLAGDELKMQETILEEEKQKKLNVFKEAKQDAIFKLHQAFGEKNFSIGGVLMKVVRHTDKVTKEQSWKVRTINVTADEQF